MAKNNKCRENHRLVTLFSEFVMLVCFTILQHHRGHPPRSPVWVFGMVDVSHQPALGYLEIVPQRDAATLLPIMHGVLRGTIF